VAFLHREARALLRIAEVIEQPSTIDYLMDKIELLEKQILTFWVPKSGIYADRDRDTHLVSRPNRLFTFQGSGLISIKDRLEHPIRLLIRISSGEEKTINPDIYIHGVSSSGKGRIEHITGKDFRWYLGNGTYTGERIYNSLDRIEIQGLKEEDYLEIYSTGYECNYISTFLPLWADIVPPEHLQTLVKRTLLNPKKYWMPFGIPYCAPHTKNIGSDICLQINIVFNAMIIEGLNNHGYKSIAADLFSKIMDAVVKNLKNEGSFHQAYNANTGDGIGERNILTGIVPVGLFLELLGIRILSPRKVELRDENPFPWPVTVKYQGLTVMKQKDKSTLIFPNGQTTEINEIKPLVICLE